VQSTDYSLTLDWFVPGILRHFDVPDLCAAVYQRPVWIANAVDAPGTALTAPEVREIYSQRIPTNSLALKNLRIFNTSEQNREMYLDWLRHS
jgi:hypothetical protein